MKKINLVILSTLMFINLALGQSLDRYANPNYVWTAFVENFNTLDRGIWNVQSHYKRDLGFLVDNPLNINVQNGNLELKMRYVPNYLDSIWKTSGWEHVYSNYTGAEISTKQLFRYGIYECIAKFAKQPGSWPAFWIIGSDGVPCPPGGYGNEIDIAEMFSYQPFPLFNHVIHRYYPPLNCDDSNHDEKDKNKYLVDMNETYVTYKCIWTPFKIEYYVNDNLRHTVNNTGQEWYPSLYLSVVLSQQVCTTYNQIGQQINPVAPQTTYFDYIRVKQFFLAPEITCPQVVCSSGTATMDVDPAATNITWALSPGYLFSGATTGSGKTAIVVASSNQGKGKITYTFNMPSGETFTAQKDIWIKGPDGSETSFDVYNSNGVRATKVGNTFLMCPNTTYHIYAMNSGPVPLSNYTWSVPSAWTQYYTSGNMISINTNSSPGGQVTVNATNTASGCNNTVQVITGYMGSNYSCGSYYMAVSPNPSTGETAVTLSADGEKVVNENTSWDVQVYDQQFGLKEKKTKLKGKEAKLNTSGWKDGVYVVNAIVDGQKISEKLVVKH